ncbi:hypothetical protein PCANC_14216 [Puccinia coronata f. sp. avenae]|uniref:Uncharacterized protein n=1 Tax=Puccinia coronata f. sp. avenae TaxID=200324 RepID=A0A2N5SYM9_9BASI|nr:hypothetical protein PCANC_14216 [Puccinia coronata f. sp. avenae]
MPSLSGLQASSLPFLYGQACFPPDPPSLPLAPTPSTSTYGLQPGDMADDVDNQPVPPPAQPQQSDNLVDQLARQVTRLREATDVTSVAQTDFMSAGPTDTLEQRHNVSVGAANVTSVW